MTEAKPNRQQRRQAARNKRRGLTPAREVHPMASMNLLEQNCELKELEINQIDKNVWDSIAAFANGKAVSAHWRTLVDASNLCEVFYERGIRENDPAADAAQFQIIKAAEAALAASLARYNAGHNLGFDGPGLIAIRELGRIHEAMLTQCTRGAWLTAMKTLRQKAKATPHHLHVTFDRDERLTP